MQPESAPERLVSGPSHGGPKKDNLSVTEMFPLNRAQLIARGMKKLIHYDPVLRDASSDGKVIEFLGQTLVHVPKLPDSLEESFAMYLNPEVELSWIGARSEDVDDEYARLLELGYINIEEMRRVLLRNLTMLAVGKAKGRGDEVRYSISRLIAEQLDRSLTGRVGFAKMAYTAQLAGEVYEEFGHEVEKVDSFDSIKKHYDKEWSGKDVIDRVFRTEPDTFVQAMLAEEEGLLSGAKLDFRALCDAATCIDSTIFPGLTLAEYRAVIIKLRYGNISMVERWTTIATDGVRVVDHGSDFSRLPNPGEVIGINLGKLRARDIVRCDSLESLRKLVLFHCASDDLENNNRVFLGQEFSLKITEQLWENAEAEIRSVFKEVGERNDSDRERHLHPKTIQRPTDSELELMMGNTPEWAKIGKPKGGLCEEPYVGPMNFEGRGGKYSIVCEEGKYFIRSRRQGLFAWVFQTEVLTGPTGRFGIKREKFQPGQELSTTAVVNTLMSKTGEDAPKYQRHAMFLAQSKGLLGDGGSSCMFPKKDPNSNGDAHNLLGVFHRRFVKEVDCVMEKSGSKIYMIIRGKPMLIKRESHNLLTLQEHSGRFLRSQHRRIQLDIGKRSIGTKAECRRGSDCAKS